MPIEPKNKRIVQSFFQMLNSNDYDSAFLLVHDEAMWWVPGVLPMSGDKTKAQYLTIARSIQTSFPQGLRFDVKSMIGEGDSVTAEVESNGSHLNGRNYQNKYHFLFQIRDSKILRVKEYMDTQHLAWLIALPSMAT